MPDWTIETALSHLETTGTFEQKKCVRIIRTLLEAERAGREAPELARTHRAGQSRGTPDGPCVCATGDAACISYNCETSARRRASR